MGIPGEKAFPVDLMASDPVRLGQLSYRVPPAEDAATHPFQSALQDPHLMNLTVILLLALMMA